MPLSTEQKTANHNELDAIQGQLVSIYNFDAKSDEVLNLKKLLAFVDQELEKNNLLLSIEEGKKRLYSLLAQCLDQSEEDAHIHIKKWVADYKKLEQRDSKKLQNIIQQHPDGLAGSLKRNGFVLDDAYMDDKDLRLLFKPVMVRPDQVKAAGTHILTPISVAPGSYATDEEKQFPHLLFLNHIDSVIKKNSKHPLTLIIPVNSEQSHWQVAIVEAKNGKIKQATLWDSLKDPDLKAKSSYPNMQTAVNWINQDDKVKVKAEAVGKQKNGHSCGDYVAQKCFAELPKKQRKKIPHLPKTTDANLLREAVVKNIVEASPELKALADKPIKSIIKPKTIIREETLEDDIFNAFTKNFQAKQIAFDEMMAKELFNILQKGPEQKNAVKQARKLAFIQFQQTFGFFKYVPDATVAAPTPVKRITKK